MSLNMIIEKKVKRVLLSFIILLLATGLLFLFFNRRNENSTAPVINNKTSEADVVIEKFHLSQNAKDRIKWELKADSAELYREKRRAVLKNIELTFMKPAADSIGETITLKGEEGVLNTETRDVSLKGKTRDIEVTTDKGYTFTVPSLRWDEAKRSIFSDDEVKLTGPNIQVNGKGLSFNVDLQQIEILNNVRTVFRKKDNI